MHTSNFLNSTWMLTSMRIRLAMRNLAFVFFSAVMPLMFLFLFLGLIARGNPERVLYMFGPVLALTVMGSFWGLSIQLVTFREQGILRRFHLAPIGPAPLLLSSILANYVLMIPTILVEFLLARFLFHLPGFGNWTGLLLVISLGTATFASFGLIVASVTNTMQETQMINNLIWSAFIFLSGASFPFGMFPDWLQRISFFLPATFLVSGLQQVLINHASVSQVGPEFLALLGGLVMAFFISVQLFRWEPEAKATRRAKLWAVATVIPFLLLGAWENSSGQIRSRANSNYNLLSRPSQSQSPPPATPK